MLASAATDWYKKGLSIVDDLDSKMEMPHCDGKRMLEQRFAIASTLAMGTQ